jgi:integrase
VTYPPRWSSLEKSGRQPRANAGFRSQSFRGPLHGDENPEWPVLAGAGRNGQLTYRWPSSVRRSVRTIPAEVGLDWMTPHTWRGTYATTLDETSLTDRAKADLLARRSPSRTLTFSHGELHLDAVIFLDAALR